MVLAWFIFPVLFYEHLSIWLSPPKLFLKSLLILLSFSGESLKVSHSFLSLSLWKDIVQFLTVFHPWQTFPPCPASVSSSSSWALESYNSIPSELYSSFQHFLIKRSQCEPCSSDSRSSKENPLTTKTGDLGRAHSFKLLTQLKTMVQKKWFNGNSCHTEAYIPKYDEVICTTKVLVYHSQRHGGLDGYLRIAYI